MFRKGAVTDSIGRCVCFCLRHFVNNLRGFVMSFRLHLPNTSFYPISIAGEKKTYSMRNNKMSCWAIVPPRLTRFVKNDYKQNALAATSWSTRIQIEKRKVKCVSHTRMSAAHRCCHHRTSICLSHQTNRGEAIDTIMDCLMTSSNWKRKHNYTSRVLLQRTQKRRCDLNRNIWSFANIDDDFASLRNFSLSTEIRLLAA